MLSERRLRPGAAEDQVMAGQIIEAAAREDGRQPISDEARLAAARGTRNSIIFLEQEAPVALGILGDGEIDLVVAPEYRRRGIGAAALTSLLGIADAGPLAAWSHGTNPAADTILERAGFTPSRTLLRLALDPNELPEPDAEISLPEGFTLRAYSPRAGDDDAGDAADWVRVNAAAFVHHPEQGALTVDDFFARTAEPWFAADDLLLAHDAAGELAGSAWVKTVRGLASGPGSAVVADTELYAIAVRPDLAGQGLGRGLNRAALVRMATHRPRSVSLYVEGDNEPALALYRAAHYTEFSRSRQWSRNLSAR